ncbi:MAG: hypothetical protein N3A57_08130, partial [Negativicutes bacterium]|nr:hypothetical protein [Negativicutes bacterium]
IVEESKARPGRRYLPPVEANVNLEPGQDEVRYIANPESNQLLFDGYGWGHGVGMSQWGARAMAESHSQEIDYYRQIVGYYYRGVTIEKLY